MESKEEFVRLYPVMNGRGTKERENISEHVFTDYQQGIQVAGSGTKKGLLPYGSLFLHRLFENQSSICKTKEGEIACSSHYIEIKENRAYCYRENPKVTLTSRKSLTFSFR